MQVKSSRVYLLEESHPSKWTFDRRRSESRHLGRPVSRPKLAAHLGSVPPGRVALCSDVDNWMGTLVAGHDFFLRTCNVIKEGCGMLVCPTIGIWGGG